MQTHGQITTRWGLACRQTDERREARTMMTAHHCCWWVACTKDGWKWWNEETQTEGETDRCGVRSHSPYISAGWSEMKQTEVQKDGMSVGPHGSCNCLNNCWHCGNVVCLTDWCCDNSVPYVWLGLPSHQKENTHFSLGTWTDVWLK